MSNKLRFCGVVVIFLFFTSAVNAFLPLSSRQRIQSVEQSLQPLAFCRRPSELLLAAKDGGGDEKKKSNKKKQPEKKKSNNNDPQARKKKSKQDQIKAVGEIMKKKKKNQEKQAKEDPNLLDVLNPFKAGQRVRETIGTALTSIAPRERKSIYYMDGRFVGADSASSGDAAVGSERNPYLERLDKDNYAPEVLVVGATGAVGRRVVRRLLLEGRFRVRVLVRDLYTRTLNLLGTGVTYCQGDLANPDSLEYALTDVDKIIFCASAPRPDEDKFRSKFEDYMNENLQQNVQVTADDEDKDDIAWEQMESTLKVRSLLAEQVDYVGMQNLVRAYQDVRVADYGISQSAKRSLFKFQDRPEDFNLFAIDRGEFDNEEDDTAAPVAETKVVEALDENDYSYGGDEDGYNYDDENAMYDETYGADDIEERAGDASVQTQVQWMRNPFQHGVFVGKVPKATSDSVSAGESAIISSRFRSRDDPENGIDLGSEFGGFIARLCSDGGTYEAFIRTGAYARDGIEYVCEFSTSTKPSSEENKSRNKFTTIRLPFDNFKPVKRGGGGGGGDATTTDAFRGQDVRHIGFRYRSASNARRSQLQAGDWSSFYLALSYIKLYRSQPEPEFVYVSDARIPPVVHNGMVRHEAKQLLSTTTAGGGGASDSSFALTGAAPMKLLDESTLQAVESSKMVVRSTEETYYKFRGEEIIKNSGLSYSIVRVSGYNELPSGETSTIELTSENKDGVSAISREEVAQVCVSALLDPNALNKSFYVGKKKGSGGAILDENMSTKFAALPTDEIV